MLSENIKKYRQAAGMNQKELAAKIHVVRQTVSKWENGLSVPDADQLILLSEVLGVSVNELLDTSGNNENDSTDIAEQLQEANEEIAHLSEQNRLQTETGRIRGAIILLTFGVLLAALVIQNEIIRLVISAVAIIVIFIIFYRNLDLLSRTLDPNADMKIIRLSTIIDSVLVAVVFGLVFLIKFNVIHLSDDQEEMLAALIVVIVMVVLGMIAPRLPYNRHTGLRLPWTVADERSWNVAHKCLGIISVPLAIIYLAIALHTKQTGTLTLVVVLLWIGIPGVLSFLQYRRIFD